jgi:hypothetical protein
MDGLGFCLQWINFLLNKNSEFLMAKSLIVVNDPKIREAL